MRKAHVGAVDSIDRDTSFLFFAGTSRAANAYLETEIYVGTVNC
jgi:hypothetical protein